MLLAEFLKKYKAKNVMPVPDNHKQSIEAANAIKIHSTGARPSYFDRVYGTIVPETYHKKYEQLFRTRLLNRHPNEAEAHYNWRLSVYAPVAKELFDKFLNLCKGSILQPNNYSIKTDEATQVYLDSQHMNEEIGELIEFILENPKGFLAVVIEGEREEDEEPRPEFVMIEEEDVIMYDHDSLAFKYEDKVFFVDKEISVQIEKDGSYIEYFHNFGKMPAWDVENTYMQPFQFWSDLLVRNMNDDEAITKHYSYPKIQQVESSCPTCQGQKHIIDPKCDPSDPAMANCEKITCGTCNGRGTITNNPGDYITVAEETIERWNGSMPELAKFITPDIGIPEFHMKRWQSFYQRVEGALYLKVVNEGTQSGEAKKEDRKDQYIFLQSISNYVFEQVQRAVQYMSMYINMSNTPSPVTVIMPKQFDLMSDSDVVNEFADLQKKTDDAQTLGELNHLVNNKIFRDNSVQKKISDVLYYADMLYGISGDALKMKYLSNVYTETDKIIHEKGYKILVRIAREMTPEMFIEAELNTFIQRLQSEAEALLPQGIYGDMASSTQANSLAESVGGLTGMIEIAKAVASGLYDLDAAVALVSSRFGISEEEARKQLGTPTIASGTQLENVVQLT